MNRSRIVVGKPYDAMSRAEFCEDFARVDTLRFPKQRVRTFDRFVIDSGFPGAIAKGNEHVVTEFRLDTNREYNIIPAAFTELLGVTKSQVSERFDRATRRIHRFVDVLFILHDSGGQVAIWEAEAMIQPATEKRREVILGRPTLDIFAVDTAGRDETVLQPKKPFPGQLGHWIYV